MSPAQHGRAAHHTSERRWPVLVVVAAVIVTVGVVVGTRGSPAPSAAPAAPASLVSPPDAESSAWYCAGQTTASGTAAGFLVLSNTTARAADAEVTSVSDSGATVHAAVSVPARGAIAPSLPSVSSGSFEADTVTVAGGGVAVSQAVHGSTGWSVAPCQSATSAVWYFPDGSTAGSNALSVALLNPTSSPVVVDLSFETPTGPVQPINYQGIVLGPGAMVVKDVGSEVQQATQVSTVVTARTGRVVASELQTFPGSRAGLAIVNGLTQPEDHWAIPQAEEVAGGASHIDVFNPSTVPEAVSLHLRLASGPLAPLTTTVAPGASWSVETSTQTRIPVDAPYSAEVDATGGPGVVVSRFVAGPSSASAPQAGLATAVDALTSGTPTNEWIVPPPGTGGNLPVGGAAPQALAVVNLGRARESFSAYAVAPGRQRLMTSVELEPGATALISGATLSQAGLDPIVVRGAGPMAVSEDLTPGGMVGAVTMPGLPLAAPIGL
ncbi:MAG TPA: DUF5719 family protein [Acidimicrobiales bacterium]|nr:DUF5719 family protein [Acidimicrobiales bacterium]